jgi:16S rRNA (guanine1516-N2)-methyltransferase
LFCASIVATGNPTVAVYCAEPARTEDALLLATRLALPSITTADDSFDLLLAYTARGLELRKTGPGAPGPVYVDFVSGPLGYRRLHANGRRPPVARAIGMRATSRRFVIDVTAGLGCDAFVLAMLGCRVWMVERSAIVYALLADGLRRARDHSLAESERLALHHQDAVSCLDGLAQRDRPDVVYLDPMYPQRDGSALNKKGMRILRELVGADEDAPELLAAALKRARRRVVVKRPRLARPLDGPSPTFQLKGKSTRYDVYRV